MLMALRRGFKSEAERIARRVRADLGVSATQSVAPEHIAELLGIEVRAGDELLIQSCSRARGSKNWKTFSPICSRPAHSGLRLIASSSYTTLSRPKRVRRATLPTNLRTHSSTTT